VVDCLIPQSSLNINTSTLFGDFGKSLDLNRTFTDEILQNREKEVTKLIHQYLDNITVCMQFY
jgi:hypothetical protein